MVQGKGQITRRAMKLPLEMLRPPLKASSNGYAFLGVEMLKNMTVRLSESCCGLVVELGVWRKVVPCTLLY